MKTTLSLVLRSEVDIARKPINYRIDNDVLNHKTTDFNGGKFTDLGLIEYEGVEYYASTYRHPE